MRVSEIESDSEKVRQRHPQVPDLDGPDKLELEGPREPLKDLEQWSDKFPKDHSYEGGIEESLEFPFMSQIPLLHCFFHML